MSSPEASGHETHWLSKALTPSSSLLHSPQRVPTDTTRCYAHVHIIMTHGMQMDIQ